MLMSLEKCVQLSGSQERQQWSPIQDLIKLSITGKMFTLRNDDNDDDDDNENHASII